MQRKCASFLLFFFSAAFIPTAGLAQEQTRDIQDISLDSLLTIQISAAAKYGQTISRAPASVTIITSEDIERYGYRTLDEVLMSVRGFYLSNDRNYGYLGVRGFSRPTDYNNRILLLVNGHSLNENVYGSAYIWTDLALDLDIVERIEIVRGPGSALYGTNAMFAVINIITKKGNAVDGVRLAAQGGSYGKLQAAAMAGKEFSTGMELFISGLTGDIRGQDLYYKEYDDPATNHGVAQNLDWDKYHGVLATISYKNFALQGIMASRKKGIPTGAYGMLFNDRAAQTQDEYKALELKYDVAIGADKNIVLRGYMDHYDYQGTYPYDVYTFDSSEGNWLGGEAQFRWDLRPDNRLTVGAEYRNNLRADYRSFDADTTFFYYNKRFTVFSFYLQDEAQLLENLSITLGIRRDEYVGSSTTPRGAIIYNPTRSSTLKFLYGEAFRAPNVYETYYEDANTGFKSNPALKAEKIRTMEVVWEQRLSDALFGIVSFYSYRMDDLIDTVMDDSDSSLQFQNVNKVKANGFEVECNARTKTGLAGYVNYVFQNARDASLKTELTNSPRHLVKMGLSYPVFKHIYAATEFQYETARLTVYAAKTTPYLLTNLNLWVKPQSTGDRPRTSWLHHLRLSFTVRNLFDVTYKTPGGFEHKQPGIVQNGRNYTVKLGLHF